VPLAAPAFVATGRPWRPMSIISRYTNVACGEPLTGAMTMAMARHVTRPPMRSSVP
jgi:hypothetical protein